MTSLWMRSEFHATQQEDYMTTDTETTLIEAANALIAEHVGKRTLWDALRDGLILRGSPAAVQVTAKPDPALLERTRVVVSRGMATVEIFDPARESWGELFRSDAPEVIPTKAAPETPPAQESRFGPPQPGQVILTDRGFEVMK
jgi:hypothetical protein